MDIVGLLFGLLLILLGANYLTDGASSVAKRFKIPELVIGLTIVAFGTSAPELTVSIVSALKNSADIAIGNVVGSNIFNTLVIVGFTALVVPVSIKKSTVSKEIPLCILASLVLFITANDVIFSQATSNVISRGDGLIFLCFFFIFLSYTFAISKNKDENTAEDENIKDIPMWKSVLFIIGGLAALIFGGELFVNGASGIARSLGVSESVIGLTLVAGGTSLPELATSIIAAIKKKPGLAIGNAIGSNLFNIFLVLGTSATIYPLVPTGITNLDYGVLIFSSLLLWCFSILFKRRTITRLEGGIMIAIYVAYITYLVINAA